ncbi:MAG: molybdopterin converting factor subunit 1 [Planctomycetia bacterium TMED53]|nr:MAG: molybdopterin converting factor subunit 1 [Planctomycetia bacterium TMED53]
MELDLLLFASLRDIAGAQTLKVDLPEGATVSELLEMIAQNHPEFAPKLPHVRVAIGDEFAQPGDTIPADQEIALIPPVSGG